MTPTSADWHIDERGCVTGPLKIGTSVEDVRRVLGDEFERFRRVGGESTQDTLAFDGQAVHVVLDMSGDTVAGLAVYRPNCVHLAGVQLLGQRIAELQKNLSTLGLDFELCDAGLRNSAIAVCLVEVEGVIDGVQIGSSG